MAGEAGPIHGPLPIFDGYSSRYAPSSASSDSSSSSDSEDELLYHHLARGRLSRQSGTSSTATAFSQKPGPDGSRVMKKRRSVPKLGLGLNACCPPGPTSKPQTPRMSDVETMCTSPISSIQETILTPHSPPPKPEPSRQVSSPRIINSYLSLSRRASASASAHPPSPGTQKAIPVQSRRRVSQMVSHINKTRTFAVFNADSDDEGYEPPRPTEGGDNKGDFNQSPVTSEVSDKLGRLHCYGLAQSETDTPLSESTSIHSADATGYVSSNTTASPVNAISSPVLSLGGPLSPLAGILRRGDDPYAQAEYEKHSRIHQQAYIKHNGARRYDYPVSQEPGLAEGKPSEPMHENILQAFYKLPPTPNNNADCSNPISSGAPHQTPHQHPATPPSQSPLGYPEAGQYYTSGIEFFLPNRVVVFAPFGPDGRLEIPPGVNELKRDPYRWPYRNVQVVSSPPRTGPKASPWEDKCRLLEAKLALQPVSRQGDSHIFVDMSNIWVGFINCYKEAKGIGLNQRIKAPTFAFELFARVLERNHNVAKRIVAGSCSTPAAHRSTWPPYLKDAARCGYTMNIFDRVLKEKTLKSFRQRRNAPASAEYASGHYDPSFTSDSNDDHAPRTVTRKGEQGVDENLHLQMMYSMMDNMDNPGTMVMATGDAATAEFSDGFKKHAIRALEAGWDFELVSWSRPISSAWQEPAFRNKWGDRFRIIELDSFLCELVGDA